MGYDVASYARLFGMHMRGARAYLR